MKWLITLLIITYNLTAQAQLPYKFFHLFLDKGLSDARVPAIVQDKYGFMWFASTNGLNRYDAYSIKTFYADKKGNGLTSNNITSLFNDSKGTLWVGTANGLVKYNFPNETFEHFPENEPINTAWINCIAEDASGNIYAGTREGLFCWYRKTNKWENLSASFNLAQRFTFIRGLLFFNEQTLYATTENKGFYKINILKKTLDTIPYKTEFSDTCCLYMIGMQKMNDSLLLIGTLSFGITKFNVFTNQFSTIQGPLRKSDSIQFNTTYQIIKDHTGRFWSASYYFRLAEYFPDKNIAVPINKDPYNPFGFDGNIAICLYEDKQNNIWIGTGTKGVYRFNPNESGVNFYGQNSAEKDGLQRGHVISLAALSKNSIMVGSDMGPSFYSRNSKRFTNFRGHAKEFGNQPLEQVQCGIMDRHGIVWMGTNRLGLMRYDTIKKSFRTFSRLTPINPLKEDGITKIIEMGGDSLMLVGWNRIVTFNTKNFTNRSFRNSTAPLHQLEKVVGVVHDKSHQNILIVTVSGKLYYYNPLTLELIDKSTLIGKFDRPLVVNNIAIDEANSIWLATNLGAIHLKEGQSPEIFTINKSVNFSNEIKNILPFGNDVWLTNNRTIAKLNSQTRNIIYLGEKHGLADVQLFGNSLTRSPWNTVLIGSNRGFYEITPEAITNKLATSTASITSFKMYEKPLVTNDVISTIKEINLGYDQNFFSFDMSAFDYSEANDIEYAYKLEGFDKDWQYIGKERKGSYTNVPGGDYVLRLRSKNSTGNWNEDGQRINMHIGKPFWLTWWFASIIILLIVLVTYTFYKYRIRSIRNKAKLRSDYEIKLNELENSALRTQMNPHFIFNSLNTINSFINRNDPTKANQYISKFSKLIRLILDHSREKKITLTEELEVLELYIQLERIRFDNKFEYSITINDAIDTDTTEIPPLIIQPFVENAILHGLLPLEKDGLLKVSVQRNNSTLLCVVEDNGIGRQQVKINRPPANEKRKSHGIDITLKRIELFNKEHHFGGTVSIHDLRNAAGNAAGTRVEIPVAFEESF